MSEPFLGSLKIKKVHVESKTDEIEAEQKGIQYLMNYTQL
jgi:hypothetical protein